MSPEAITLNRIIDGKRIEQRDFDACSAALENARVVELLDTWAAGDPPFREWAMQMGHGEPDTCHLTDMRIGSQRNIKFDANTPNEARAAAAKAIESGEVP